MADIAFKGLGWIDGTSPAYSAGDDFSLKITEVRGIPEKNKIAKAATLGGDHVSEILGHSLYNFGITFEDLTDAQKVILIAYYDAKTPLEFYMMDAAGTPGTPTTAIPDNIVHFYLPAAPTIAMSPTAINTFTFDIQAAYFKWNDGAASLTLGTALI